MMEDELIKLWQSSGHPERIKFEKSRLMIELNSSLSRLHRWWKYIEQIHLISALVTVPPFVLAVIWVPYTSMKIASALIIVWAIFVGSRVLGIKKFKPHDLEENYLTYLEKTKTYLFAQKRMLETSLNWAILTIYPIYILFWVEIWEKPSARNVAVLSFVALVGVGIYEYYISKRRIQREINPRITQVNELIKKLKE